MSFFRTLTQTLAILLAASAMGCAQNQPAPDASSSYDSSTADYNSFNVKQGLINVSKKLPRLLELGQDMTYSIQLRATDDARNVTIREEIPSSARYVHSDPEARVLGNQLIWSFPEMARGDTKVLSITLKPVQEGRIEGYTTVAVEPQAYAATVVGKPRLALAATGPSTAIVGKDVTYEMTITNNGTYVAKGVALTDQVPDGLMYANQAREVVKPVGDLEPGQSVTVPITFKAMQRGTVRNVSLAYSSNADTVTTESSTLLLLQTLNVATRGPDEEYVGKTAPYEVTVSNPGDVPLKQVKVTDAMPADGQILQATGATVAANAATWEIGELAPGEQKVFTLTATTMTPGVARNSVSVNTAESVTAQGEYSTLWRGLPGLSLHMNDSADPLKVGDMTVFTITLNNQGSAADTNVRVQMSFPSGLVPVNSGGATSATVSGQIVSFAPVAALGPKQSLTWTVQARGVTAGDNRTRVQYTSDTIKVPVSKDESTQVY